MAAAAGHDEGDGEDGTRTDDIRGSSPTGRYFYYYNLFILHVFTDRRPPPPRQDPGSKHDEDNRHGETATTTALMTMATITAFCVGVGFFFFGLIFL